MSHLRPQCRESKSAAIPDDTALFLIRDAVARRGALIHGKLDGRGGTHCAMGCFFADNPTATVYERLIDEVAAVNDSVPNATPQERWQKVMEWLRWKVKVLASRNA